MKLRHLAFLAAAILGFMLPASAALADHLLWHDNNVSDVDPNLKCSLTVLPYDVKPGQELRVTWEVKGAVAVGIHPKLDHYKKGQPIPASGEDTAKDGENYSYVYLVAKNAAGDKVKCELSRQLHKLELKSLGAGGGGGGNPGCNPRKEECPPPTCEPADSDECQPPCDETSSCPPPPTCEELNNCPPPPCGTDGRECPPPPCEETNTCPPPPTCEELNNCPPPPTCEELNNCPPPPTCEQLHNCPPPPCEETDTCPPPPTCDYGGAYPDCNDPPLECGEGEHPNGNGTQCVPDHENCNNGVGNGPDCQPPGDPPVNDCEGTSPGDPGNQTGECEEEDEPDTCPPGESPNPGGVCKPDD
ncbi:MAG: hypothetical protein V4436_02815 [Patescibacteria group bacterium]